MKQALLVNSQISLKWALGELIVDDDDKMLVDVPGI